MNSRANKKEQQLYPADLLGGEETLAPGQGERSGKRRFEKRAGLDDSSPAFAESEHLAQNVNALFEQDKRALKGKIAGGIAIFAVVFLVSLCIKPNVGSGFMNPADVLQAIAMHVALPVQQLMGNAPQFTHLQLVEQYPAYLQVEQRFAVSLVTALCGLLLAVAGSLYQMVFRNPIAAPTMLGVSNGVSLGVLVFVLVYGQAAVYMDGLRCVFSYAGAVAVLLLVLLLTKLICGKSRQFSIFELLLTGSIFSQVCGSVVQVVQDTVMSDELWEVYRQVSEATNSVITPVTIVTVLVVAAVTLVPVFLMRFSINSVSFTSLEERLMGLDTRRLKVLCLVFGTCMVIVAQVTVGTVSMVALVVPFVSRALFGTEFKHQLWGDLIMGAVLLLLCRDLVLLFPFYGMELTMGCVVSFITLPFYVWIVASKQRGWD